MKRADAAQIRRARAILCHFCPYADHDGPWFNSPAIRCSVSGKPVEAHITSCAPSCPMGSHPDKEGYCRVAGVVTCGVFKLWRWLFPVELTGPVPGCGCFQRLKGIAAFFGVRRPC
jgi:hypothetical protein